MSASSIFIAACYSLYNLWLFQILLDFRYQADNAYFIHIFYKMLVSKLFSFTWFTALLRGNFLIMYKCTRCVENLCTASATVASSVEFRHLPGRAEMILLGAIPFFKVQKPFTTVIGFRYEPIP